MLEAIQIAASALALATAALYVLGGLIVNIYLSKYKITEYQIVSVHYLVVGAVFLLNVVWTLLQGIFAAFFVTPLIFINQQLLSLPLPILFGLSLFASVVLILPDNIRSRTISGLVGRIRGKLMILRLLSLLYPFTVAIRSSILLLSGTVSQQDTSSAPSLFMFAIIALTYDYAWRVYGAPIDDKDNRMDIGIGRGTPRPVRLAGDQKDMHLLALVDIPLINSELTNEIFLLAETSNHYIVTRTLDENGEAIKVRKEIVSALQHKRMSQSNHKAVSVLTP